MHLHVNIITLAVNEEDARSNVRCWIDEYAGREFFDWGGLEEPDEKVVLLSEIMDRLEKEKVAVDTIIPDIEKDIKRHKENGDKGAEGFCHKRLGAILLEDPTDDMPFFNIENWDWSLPTEIPEEREYCNWYAVMADLHF
jgi:hypothetical protein